MILKENFCQQQVLFITKDPLVRFVVKFQFSTFTFNDDKRSKLAKLHYAVMLVFAFSYTEFAQTKYDSHNQNNSKAHTLIQNVKLLLIFEKTIRYSNIISLQSYYKYLKRISKKSQSPCACSFVK